MKKALRYVLIGASVYLVFLVITVPAPLAYSFLKKSIASVSLYEMRGTIWSGRAAVVQYGAKRFEKVSWEFHPWSLLLGRIEAGVACDYQDGTLAAVVGRGIGGTVYAHDVQANLPARELADWLQLPDVKFSGDVAVQLETIKIEEGRVTVAEGEVMWNDAGLNDPVVAQLGVFRGEVSTDGEQGIKLSLMDQGGPVSAEGLFTLARDGQYQINFKLGSRDTKQSVIGQALRFLGNPGADGRVTISRAGVMTPLFAASPE